MVTGKKRACFRSNISRTKYRQVVRLFAMDLEATKVAQLTHLSRRTVNRYFHPFRVRIAAACEVGQALAGTVEVDESYFGAPTRTRQGRARRLSQDDRVWHLQTQRHRLYADHSKRA